MKIVVLNPMRFDGFLDFHPQQTTKHTVTFCLHFIHISHSSSTARTKTKMERLIIITTITTIISLKFIRMKMLALEQIQLQPLPPLKMCTKFLSNQNNHMPSPSQVLFCAPTVLQNTRVEYSRQLRPLTLPHWTHHYTKHLQAHHHLPMQQNVKQQHL
jgi:hypothetical protein